MSFYGSSPQHEPVTYVRGHPIYAAHFVVLVFVASMVATTALMFAHADAIGAWAIFESGLVLRGEVWRLFTYGLWNPPSIGFAIDMLMIIWFGREIEKFFGRAKFLVLYVCVYLLTPVLFTALGRWMPMTLAGETGAFAIFIAFATLYPNVDILFGLLAKWIAWVLVGIYTLMALAGRNWEMLISLWATTAFAYGFIRYEQGQIELPRIRLPRRKPKLRVVPDLPAKPARQVSASTAEVDALLDKIAQSGFASLTPKERAKLEEAREKLRRRSNGA